MEDARKHIEHLVKELKNKPLAELAAIGFNNTAQAFPRDEAIKIWIWSEKNPKTGRLSVVVEARKHVLFGIISFVTALGFFVDENGITDMKEEDMWDAGY